MRAYVYQAALYCEDCGEVIKSELDKERLTPDEPDNEHTFDSDEYPKGPYGDGGGEADCPQYCDNCGEFLENPLTSDGMEWVESEGSIEQREYYGLNTTSYYEDIINGLDRLRDEQPAVYEQLVFCSGLRPIPAYAMDDPNDVWWMTDVACRIKDEIEEALNAESD